MSVTVSGLSGLTNAYTSVLSATGSLEISGASRCDDMRLPHRNRSGQPGGQRGVVNLGPAGAGEDLQLARAGVAEVHDDRGVGRGRRVVLLWRGRRGWR